MLNLCVKAWLGCHRGTESPSQLTMRAVLRLPTKLDSHTRRTEAVLNNHQNALSFLQVQDGALETIGSVVNRMAELRTMAADVTKNTSDVENYSKEFRELQSQLNQIRKEKFNGISLFAISEWNIGQGTLNGKLSNDYSFLNADGSTHTETNDYKGFSRELFHAPIRVK